MTAARTAFGGILGTVTSTAATLTSSLDSINSAVGMANAFITKASKEQQLRHLADEESFIDRLIDEKSRETANMDLSIKKFLSKSQDHADFYEKASEKFTALLRPNQDSPKP